jgi:hypothetical protein
MRSSLEKACRQKVGPKNRVFIEKTIPRRGGRFSISRKAQETPHVSFGISRRFSKNAEKTASFRHGRVEESEKTREPFPNLKGRFPREIELFRWSVIAKPRKTPGYTLWNPSRHNREIVFSNEKNLANREKHSGKTPLRKPPYFSEKTCIRDRRLRENPATRPYKRFGKSLVALKNTVIRLPF